MLFLFWMLVCLSFWILLKHRAGIVGVFLVLVYFDSCLIVSVFVSVVWCSWFLRFLFGACSGFTVLQILHSLILTCFSNYCLSL